nr:sulfite oxidase-like oxidoreductase [Desulfobacula sp.]
MMKETTDIVSTLSLEGEILRVTGRVAKPLVLSMADILAMETEEFQDLFIVCGTGEPRDTIRQCRGVLMEKIIQKAEVLKGEHNDTKKMAVVASAADGYKVVFSWQEIFNTPIGGGVAVLTEKDGAPLEEKQDRIDLISAQDYFAGSRYVRDLKQIEVVLFP